jgi:hypothetical protein
MYTHNILTSFVFRTDAEVRAFLFDGRPSVRLPGLDCYVQKVTMARAIKNSLSNVNGGNKLSVSFENTDPLFMKELLTLVCFRISYLCLCVCY